MDYNEFLLRLGLDSSQFVNRLNEPIKTATGWLYEVDQKSDTIPCPFCKGTKVYINDYHTIETNCRESNHIIHILRVRKVRLRCVSCHKTFTPELNGLILVIRRVNKRYTLFLVNLQGKLLSRPLVNATGYQRPTSCKFLIPKLNMSHVVLYQKFFVLMKFVFQSIKINGLFVFCMTFIKKKSWMLFAIVKWLIFASILMKLVT